MNVENGFRERLRPNDLWPIAVQTNRSSSKLSKSGVALLILGSVAACNARPSHSDVAPDEVQAATQEMEQKVEVLIPKSRDYSDPLKLKVTLPSRYIWAADSEEGRRGLIFRPIDYRTLEPVDDHPQGVIGIATYFVGSRYRVGDSPIRPVYERYPDIGEMRFGLSYRPDPVPGRPESLWKRYYFKPGVSGEEFSIGCLPPIGPGSIIEPTVCGMTLMFPMPERNGRPAGIFVNASLPASRIEDWRLVEAAMRKLVAPNVEWVGGKN